MESGIKNSYLRYMRHKLRAYADTDQVCRIVQRRKIVALFHRLDHLVCDHCRCGKFFSAVYDAVADSAYLVKALDSACLLINQSVKDHLDSLFVCGHGSFCNLFVAAGFLIHQSSVNTDSLAETFCKNRLCLGINKLIL